MKIILLFTLFFSFASHSSVIGISTHPLNEEGRVFSAEMTGFMSQRSEVGAGLRYTQEVDRYRILDFTAAGAQDSRGLRLGAGMDFEILSEDVSAPRLSIKPYWQHQKYEAESANLMGVAPTIRKGFSLSGQEFFPYLALPAGLKIDSTSDEFVYYASMTFGASMPLPGDINNRILLSLEGNKNMGASSDYLGLLVSWIWK